MAIGLKPKVTKDISVNVLFDTEYFLVQIKDGYKMMHDVEAVLDKRGLRGIGLAEFAAVCAEHPRIKEQLDNMRPVVRRERIMQLIAVRAQDKTNVVPFRKVARE